MFDDTFFWILYMLINSFLLLYPNSTLKQNSHDTCGNLHLEGNYRVQESLLSEYTQAKRNELKVVWKEESLKL